MSDAQFFLVAIFIIILTAVIVWVCCTSVRKQPTSQITVRKPSTQVLAESYEPQSRNMNPEGPGQIILHDGNIVTGFAQDALADSGWGFDAGDSDFVDLGAALKGYAETSFLSESNTDMGDSRSPPPSFGKEPYHLPTYARAGTLNDEFIASGVRSVQQSPGWVGDSDTMLRGVLNYAPSPLTQSHSVGHRRLHHLLEEHSGGELDLQHPLHIPSPEVHHSGDISDPKSFMEGSRQFSSTDLTGGANPELHNALRLPSTRDREKSLVGVMSSLAPSKQQRESTKTAPELIDMPAGNVMFTESLRDALRSLFAEFHDGNTPLNIEAIVALLRNAGKLDLVVDEGQAADSVVMRLVSGMRRDTGFGNDGAAEEAEFEDQFNSFAKRRLNYVQTARGGRFSLDEPLAQAPKGRDSMKRHSQAVGQNQQTDTDHRLVAGIGEEPLVDKYAVIPPDEPNGELGVILTEFSEGTQEAAVGLTDDASQEIRVLLEAARKGQVDQVQITKKGRKALKIILSAGPRSIEKVLTDHGLLGYFHIDGDGNLSITEIMGALDTNGDGIVSFEEFAAAIGIAAHLTCEDDANLPEAWVVEFRALLHAARKGQGDQCGLSQRGLIALALVQEGGVQSVEKMLRDEDLFDYFEIGENGNIFVTQIVGAMDLHGNGKLIFADFVAGIGGANDMHVPGEGKSEDSPSPPSPPPRPSRERNQLKDMGGKGNASFDRDDSFQEVSENNGGTLPRLGAGKPRGPKGRKRPSRPTSTSSLVSATPVAAVPDKLDSEFPAFSGSP
jgi:hypothetical protein